jgi:adenylosuccinate lyase
MRRIFEEENRLQRMLDVEAALAWAHAQVGNIPATDAQVIVKKASTKHVKLERVKAIEVERKHDVVSVVRALSEQAGKSGAYVHLGVTSYDIVDTANALLLKDALNLIESRLLRLEHVLMEKADKYKRTIMAGRTHGQHALPITLGFKFAVWMRQNARDIQRLGQCSERLLVGKVTGAVGTQAGLGSHAVEVQELVMRRLSLRHADISTQVVQRDLHAEFICLVALVASSLENIATEVRELQRPEIAELSEVFEYERQVGSSSMPQKRNPEICERICGLSRILRSLTVPALENVVTWHERDLTQSSAERFLIPEACILVEYIIFLMTEVLANLQVHEKRMQQNLEVTQGRIMAEAVMTALVEKGMNRQDAHELLRKLTIESESQAQKFKKILLGNRTIRRYLNPKEIENALDPHKYLGTAVEQIQLMIKKTRQERRPRT